jgi:hypothetical protein
VAAPDSRDRERHESRVACREARKSGVGVGRTDQQFTDRAYDACARRGAEFHQRVQTLLVG